MTESTEDKTAKTNPDAQRLNEGVVIKPCPFCGYDKPQLVDKKDAMHFDAGMMARLCYVECPACYAQSAEQGCQSKTYNGINELPASAISKWNTRAL